MRLAPLPIAAALAATALSLGLLAAPAQASDVEEAQQRVEELGREVAALTEDYNELREEAGQQKTRAEAAGAQVADQQVRIEKMQGELTGLAIEAFKRGGVDPQLAILLRGGAQYAHSTSTLSLLGERRSVSLSSLREAQVELRDLQREEEEALAAVERTERDLAEKKDTIEGQLAAAEDDLRAAQEAAAERERQRQAAIRAAAERRAAEEAASRARAAAEAEAAQTQAAQAAQAADTSSSSGGSSSSGSGSDGSGSSSGSGGSGSGGSGSGGSGSGGSGGGSGSDGGAEAAPVSGGTTVNCGGRSVKAPDSRTATVISFACSQMGKPYLWGAGGPNAYDCSGLTSRAWAQVGVSLPHSSRMQYSGGQKVSRGDMRPGDLVYFYSPISHVGIYIGNGELVAAPSSGDVVKIQSMSYMPYAGATRH